MEAKSKFMKIFQLCFCVFIGFVLLFKNDTKCIYLVTIRGGRQRPNKEIKRENGLDNFLGPPLCALSQLGWNLKTKIAVGLPFGLFNEILKAYRDC